MPKKSRLPPRTYPCLGHVSRIWPKNRFFWTRFRAFQVRKRFVGSNRLPSTALLSSPSFGGSSGRSLRGLSGSKDIKRSLLKLDPEAQFQVFPNAVTNLWLQNGFGGL